MTVPVKRIREIAEVIMGTSPKGHTYNHAGEGMPLLNGPTTFGESHPECSLYTTASVKECKPGDLIFCVRGSTTGRMNWADKAYSLGRGVCAIRGDTGLGTKFIRYCLEYRLPALLQLAGGTTFPNLPQDTIKDFEVPFPSSHKEIASTLSAYDDLIENNQRRIALLEQAARLLYQEWFVRLRFPGHEHVRIVDGVPEGWEKTQIEDVVEFLGRGITPKYDDEASGIVINQKCIRNRLVNLGLARRQSREVPKDRLVRFGDVLVNSTGEGTLGRVAQFLDEIENCTVDSHVTIVRPARQIPMFFFGLSLGNLEEYLSTMGRGATNQSELSRTTIAQIPLVLPPTPLGKAFDDSAQASFLQITNLLGQNKRLKEARDLLLPRLMNGEIAV